jgi:cytosine/adenosine deaminase-related metal-dependent hydrolase
MLVRGRYVVADPRRTETILADGAVYVEKDRILALGPYDELRRQHPLAPGIGSGEQIVLPGLINAHDHGRGLSTIQMGLPDRTVELWLLSLGDLPVVDPYLSAAYAAAMAIESGITTVLNCQYEGDLAAYESNLAAGFRGYHESGLRVVWALGILDRSPVSAIYKGCLAGLPRELLERTTNFLSGRHGIAANDYFALVHNLEVELRGEASGRASLMLGPVSAHWCSDELLLRLLDYAETTRLGMHMHLLESAYQRQEAFKANGESMVAHLARLRFLGPRLSCAHCVWVTERDIDLLAQCGTSAVHNPGSNLRLGSGIAPVGAMLARGVNVALGLDSNTLSDNGDMLQEMRLAATLHRLPGQAANNVDAGQWFGMATAGGARALLLDDAIGVLAPGKKADIVLLNPKRVQFPYAAPDDDPLPLLLARADARDVDSVLIDGQLVMHQRRLLTIDKEAIAAELRDQVSSAVARQGKGLPSLAQALLPYAQRFCNVDEGRLTPPFCRCNCQEEP